MVLKKNDYLLMIYAGKEYRGKLCSLNIQSAINFCNHVFCNKQ